MTESLKELQALLALLSILNMIGLWAVAIYTWQANRKRVTTERIATLQKAMDANMESLKSGIDRQNQRLTAVERDLKNGPTHDDLKRLHQRIDALAGGVRELAGEFKGANATLHLIHAYMLKGSKE